jgi:hypothetical protein
MRTLPYWRIYYLDEPLRNIRYSKIESELGDL